MYDYKICMKSGKEYKITTDFKFEELVNKIMPRNINEFRFSSFNLLDNGGNIVGILGSEVSSIEYFIKIDK